MAAHEDLLKEVQSSIEKALPAIQVDVFRKYVDESEKTKRDHEKLKNDYSTLTINAERDFKELQSLRSLKLRAEKIDSDQQTLDLQKKTFEIEKQLKDLQVQCASEKVTLIYGLVNSLFRNIDVRKNTLGSIPVIQESNYNGQVSRYTTSAPADLMETETKE